MNAIGFWILMLLVAEFALQTVVDLLNLAALKEDPPAAFAGWCDDEKYRRSQRYLKANTRFGLIKEAYDLGLLLVFWLGGGFPLLDGPIRGLQAGPLAGGLLFIGVLAAARALLDLPFDLYHTFGIEARFGFNRCTLRLFLQDRLKGLLLGVVLGVPLLAGVLAVFQFGGPWAWCYAWMGVSLYSLVLHFVAPRWIMPLFNRFEPLEPGELRTAISAYAAGIGFSLENIYVMDGSRRSTKSNAFFTGFGRHRRIVLFDTLIAQHSPGEVVGVLAHEMGHFKKRHVMRMQIMSVCQLGLMLLLFSRAIEFPPLFHAFYLDTPSIYAGLVLFAVCLGPLETLLGPLMQWLSRRHEYAADRYAVETTADADGFCRALIRLSVDNLSNLTPHPAYVWLHYSHPPVVRRLAAVRARTERSS